MSETKTERPIGKIHSTTIMSFHGNLFIFHIESNAFHADFLIFERRIILGFFVAMKNKGV